ncbi:MAG: hypothetical protein DRP41_00230 [Thermodesulfobacteriota bacterium]|nr:MAG: hypothetical protein DRP41_00230 [Thermodesulfobacteriota bacterium]
MIINIHDVSPFYKAELENTVSFLSDNGVKRFSLFVIPYLWSRIHLRKYPSFVKWLKGLKGCDFVLHGYTHQNLVCSHVFNRLLTNKEGEFFKIGHKEAIKRLSFAKAIISKAGIETNSFAPPAWLIGKEEKEAVCHMGFEHLITARGVYMVREKKFIFLPAISFTTRTRFRTFLSRISYAWPGLFRRKMLRIDLHPWDIKEKWLQNKLKLIFTQRETLALKEVLP